MLTKFGPARKPGYGCMAADHGELGLSNVLPSLCILLWALKSFPHPCGPMAFLRPRVWKSQHTWKPIFAESLLCAFKVLFGYLLRVDLRSVKKMCSKVKGSTVHGTGRHGKYFWISFMPKNSKDPDKLCHIILHFGMTGYLDSKEGPKAVYKRRRPQDENLWPPRLYSYLPLYQHSTSN